MEILTSLGVNHTLWMHFLCFLVAFSAFWLLILKPYGAALREREKRTVGNEEAAVQLVEQANDLHAEYEKKARAVNVQIKGFYDTSRTEAQAAYEKVVSSARAESSAALEKARAQISKEIQTARQTISADVPAIGAAIASKLAGKDISL